jgi:oligosaccharide repeat unit polymerase
MSISTFKNILLSIALVLTSLIISPIYKWVGLLFFFASYLVLFYTILKNNGIYSIAFVFNTLFGLYTFSLPLSILFNLDVGKYREQYLPSWPQFDFTLEHYLLSSSLFQLGFLIALLIIYTRFKTSPFALKERKTYNLNFYSSSIISGILSSLFELINFLRVGGFEALKKGKAFYQSAVSDISLTLPSEGFFFISIILFALSFSYAKNKKRTVYFLLFIIVNSFYLFINLFIGERGSVLLSIVFFIFSFNYYYFINRIKLKYLLYGVIFLFFISIITIYRNFFDDKDAKPTFSNIYNYVIEHRNNIVFAMNPANIEFSAPALVYRVYFYNNNKIKPRFGLTYLYFIPNSIPTYLNPYRAPSLLYELRDNFFKDRVKKGSNASVGYSLLLESYLNFLFIGPFIIGALLSLFISWLESKKYTNNFFYIITYVLFLNIILILFRSTSEFIFQTIILYVIQILFVFIISYLLKMLNFILK